MIFYFLTISVLGVMHIAGSPSIILETINPLNAVHFFLADGWHAFLALGSVVLAVTGAEALYADMGHFGRKPIGISWLFFVMPALMLNYMGQGAMILALDPAAADATLANPVLLPRARKPAPAARHPRHLRHDHRQPGGDLGRLLGDPAGDAPRLHPAPQDPAHQRGRGRPDLHPGGELGADGHGHPARPVLPEFEQPRRRLRHRRHRRDVHRHLPAHRRPVRAVEVEALDRGADPGRLLPRRHRLFRGQPHQGARRRLVPAAGRPVRLHPAHHLGARAAS